MHRMYIVLILLGERGGRILEVYDIMGYEGTLYVPPSGDFALFLVCFWESVVELCVVFVLVYSMLLDFLAFMQPL